MDKLQEYYKNAILANLCTEYKEEWRAAGTDKEQLFRLALVQQSIPHWLTFAYNKQGITKEYVETEFSEYINGKYTAIDVDGVEGNYKTCLYVGFKAILKPENDVSVFAWANVPLVEIKACHAPKLYVGCNSNINITPQGFTSIIIMLFDESTISIDECDNTNEISIYKYSKKAKVNTDKFCLANIKTFNKTLKL